MLLQILKSKIHRVQVTEANLEYVGSITIDQDLMDASNIYAGERVQVVDNTNGAAAHLVHVGDTVIIMAYALMSPEETKAFKPAIVFPVNNKL